MQKITVIVPAYNEEGRIGPVLGTLLRAQKRIEPIDKIIVINDGSTDDTLQEAKEALKGTDNTVISFSDNQGKGSSLQKGVELSETSLLFFVDADLINFEVSHINKMIEPAVEQDFGLVNGVLDRGRQLEEHILSKSSLASKIGKWIGKINRTISEAPLSGIRVVQKEIWDQTPKVDDFYIDLALYHTSLKKDYIVKNVVLTGMTHHSKVMKRGLFMGWWARGKMYIQIGVGFIKFRLLH